MAYVDDERPDRQEYKLRCGFNLDAALIVSDAAGTLLLSGRSASSDALFRRSLPGSRVSGRPRGALGSTNGTGSSQGNAVVAGLEHQEDDDHELDGTFGSDDAVRSDGHDGRAPVEDGDTAAGQSLPAAPRRAPVEDRLNVNSSANLSIEKDVLASMFYQELRVAVGVAARMGGGVAGGVLPGAAVHGAQALVFEDQGDPMITWLSVQDGTVMVLCTCCRVLGNGVATLTGLDMEYPQLQAARKLSSTCRHAGALMAALDMLGHDVGASDWDELFTALPLLLGPQDSDAENDSSSTTVCFAKNLGKRGKVPVFAVLYEDTWSPVIIRPTGNRLKLAACHLLSCQTQPWGCIHAKAVNRYNRIAASDAALTELRQTDMLAFGPAGILLGDGAPPSGAPAPAEGQTSAAVAPAAPRQKRRGRNMFPCVGEILLCEEFHAACDRLRAADEERYIDETHAEKSCLSCGQLRLDADVTSTLVELYTLRGRMTTRVGKWSCSRCHAVVLYDGANEGLFAASPEVVYVRVFMDAILEICVIARSTMAAAAEYLTSLLRNTAAYEDGETGQVRQNMSDAVGEFSDTLVIPELAFQCGTCGSDEATGGEFAAVLADGQIASILQEHVLPMMRPASNLPKADFAITYACATRVPLIRNLIRRRCRAHADAAVEVSEAEERLWGSFASSSLMAAPASPPLPSVRNPGACRTTEQRNSAVDWAASTVFKTFFSVHVVADGAVHQLVPNVGRPGRAASAARRGEGRAAARRGRRPAPVVASSASETEDGSSVNLLSDAESAGRVGNGASAQGSGSEYGSSLLGDDGLGLDIDLEVNRVAADDSGAADGAGTRDVNNAAGAVVDAVAAVPSYDVGGTLQAPTDDIEQVLGQIDLNDSLAHRADAAGPSLARSPPRLSDGDQAHNVGPGASRASSPPTSSNKYQVLIVGAAASRAPSRPPLSNGAQLNAASGSSPASSPPPSSVAAHLHVCPAVGYANESRASGRFSAMPAAQLDVAVELSPALVARTQDLWRVPLTSVEVSVPGQPPSSSPVVLDSTDPCSPLTLKAVEETNKAIAVSTEDPMRAYVTVHGIPLTKDSLRRLVPPEWLNDEVVNGYVQLLRERSGCRVAPAAGPMLFLSSFFYARMFERNEYSYQAVHRWTRRVDVLRKEKIFIPVNIHQAHWMLAVIEPTQALVSLYDSMGSTLAEVKQVLLSWARDETASRGQPARAWRAVQQPCRQQDNSNDCGVYMLKTMDFISKERPLCELRSSTAYYRRRIAAELLDGTL